MAAPPRRKRRHRWVTKACPSSAVNSGASLMKLLRLRLHDCGPGSLKTEPWTTGSHSRLIRLERKTTPQSENAKKTKYPDANDALDAEYAVSYSTYGHIGTLRRRERQRPVSLLGSQRTNMSISVQEYARGRCLRADKSEFARGNTIRNDTFATPQQEWVNDLYCLTKTSRGASGCLQHIS